MYEIEYSFAWKLERICSAIMLYFQWICLVSSISAVMILILLFY